MAHQKGELKRDGLRVDFDRCPKLEFHASKVTSDTGLPACRGLDDAVGLTEVAVPRNLYQKKLDLIDDLRRRLVPA